MNNNKETNLKNIVLILRHKILKLLKPIIPTRVCGDVIYGQVHKLPVETYTFVVI